mgnify:CR=1 FL=1
MQAVVGRLHRALVLEVGGVPHAADDGAGSCRLGEFARQPGVDARLDALIAAVMDEFSTERSETEENIRAILERKYPMAREDEKVRRRAVAALQRYGYGFDEIFSVLNSEE